MILLVDQRRSYTEITRIFDTNTVIVSYWIGRFNADGSAGLYDRPRSGRPRKVTGAVKEAVKDLVQRDPTEKGYVMTLWTVAMPALAVISTLGVSLSHSSERDSS